MRGLGGPRPFSTAASAGMLLALLAGLTLVVWPASWLTVALAGLATLLLGQDPDFGWLPGGLLVALAVPFGRGADLAPLTVGGVPLRPHDTVLAVTILGVLLAAVRNRLPEPLRALDEGRRTLIVAAVAFAGVGVIAIGWGWIEGQTLRDVLRDARWWFLYLMAPLALLARTNVEALVRALIAGTCMFAIVIIATLALPAFDGGLLAAAVQADSGAIRMQYGNSIFLVPAVAYLVQLSLRAGGSWRAASLPLAALALTWSALVLSLTRISILVALAIGLGLVAWLAARAGRAGRGPSLGQGLAVVLLMGASSMASITLITATTFALAEGGRQPTPPLERLLFGEEGSDLDAILGSGATGGRLATYRNAYEILEGNPVMGGGMGQQVEVQFATRPGRAFTPGQQPGVDNAYLTAGVKAGVAGIATLAALLLLPLWRALRGVPPLPAWYVAGWLGLLALTLTQSFAVSGYAPVGVALLAALAFLPGRASGEGRAMITA